MFSLTYIDFHSISQAPFFLVIIDFHADDVGKENVI